MQRACALPSYLWFDSCSSVNAHTPACVHVSAVEGGPVVTRQSASPQGLGTLGDPTMLLSAVGTWSRVLALAAGHLWTGVVGGKAVRNHFFE